MPSEVDTQNLNPAAMARLMSEPLLAVPPEIRPALWNVWSSHQHLFPSALPLAATLGRWIREKGLTVEDANRVLNDAMEPEKMSDFKFASDLMTFVAARCGLLIKHRNNVRAAKDRAAPVENALPAQEVRKLLREMADDLGTD